MNARRILAIIGLALIGLLYLVALVCALIRHPFAKSLLMAALFSTIALPVIIYTWQLIIRLLKDRRDGWEDGDGDGR